MDRKKHPIKEIEEAVKYAESQGWQYKKLGKVDTHGGNYNALRIAISVDAVSFALLAYGAHLETLLIMRNKSKVTWISAYS